MATTKTKAATTKQTKEKSSVTTNRLIKTLNTNIRRQLDSSNIPIFMLMKDTINLETFFLNNQDFQALLGENYDLLDRIIMTAICSNAATEIKVAIEESAEVAGVWDEYTIYNIAAATVTFMKHDTTPLKFFTAHQYAVISEDDLKNLPEGTYMPFNAYTNDFFRLIYNQIVQVVMTTIIKIVNAKIPKINVHTKDTPLNVSLTNTFADLMTDDIKEWRDITSTVNFRSQEPSVQNFISFFEKPFILFLSIIAKESGISSNVINLTLGMSKLHFIYEDPGIKTLEEIGITFIMAAKDLLPNDSNAIKFETNIGEILNMTISYPNLSKKSKLAYGKSLRTLVNNTCTYMINVYNAIVSGNSSEEINVPEFDTLLED